MIAMRPAFDTPMDRTQKQTLLTPVIAERRLLKRLKKLCGRCDFKNPRQYKLHSFRHHFASLCANHNVAYRKALAWLGHSSSEMLDLYYHLHDEDSRNAMIALAESGTTVGPMYQEYSTFEGKEPVKNRENVTSP
jgi:integrase